MLFIFLYWCYWCIMKENFSCFVYLRRVCDCIGDKFLKNFLCFVFLGFMGWSCCCMGWRIIWEVVWEDCCFCYGMLVMVVMMFLGFRVVKFSWLCEFIFEFVLFWYGYCGCMEVCVFLIVCMEVFFYFIFGFFMCLLWVVVMFFCVIRLVYWFGICV